MNPIQDSNAVMEEVIQQIEEKEQPSEQNTETKEEIKTDAELALENGKHIREDIEEAYVQEIVEKIQSRKVVSSNSSNLVRYNEQTLFRQTFDEMSGYQNLVKLNAKESAEQALEIHSEIDEIYAVMLFPDQSYVFIDLNESVVCRIPKGKTVIIYIGNHIKGSIEAEFIQNEIVTYERM